MQKQGSSRRAMLASLAGLAVAGSPLRAAAGGRRSLVCIRLTADTGYSLLSAGSSSPDTTVTSARSRRGIALQPGAAGFARLFERSSLALVEEPGAVEWDYVAGGFAAPAWMLRNAGAGVQDSRHTWGFRSGLLMIAPEEEGSGFDDPRLLAEAAASGFEFPATAIGRQLQQAAGLLAAAKGPRHFVAAMGASATVGDRAAQDAARTAQLSDALAAFTAATDALGSTADVVAFTAPDRSAANARQLRLLWGGRVLGGELYSSAAPFLEDALREWSGDASVLAGGRTQLLF